MEHIENILRKKSSEQLTCIDYSVSKEEFTLQKNNEYDMLYTSPIPNNLYSYYESDDYISHTDSNKTLMDKVYQFVKKINLKNKLALVNKYSTPTEEKSILYIGAGTGVFLNTCKKNDWKVEGIEPSENARALSKTKNIVLKNNLNEITNNKFDVITMWHVLEHINNLNETINKLNQLLNDNGTLIIAVPNYKSYDAKYYKSFWAAYDVPRHIWHFSQTAIKKIFNQFNFKVIKILPMKFDAYYISLLSEKNKTGKLNPLKAFYKGLQSNIKAKKENEYSSLIFILKKEKN